MTLPLVAIVITGFMLDSTCRVIRVHAVIEISHSYLESDLVKFKKHSY